MYVSSRAPHENSDPYSVTIKIKVFIFHISHESTMWLLAQIH